MKLVRLIEIEKHDVKWLFDLQSQGLLEVDDSFQRHFVWTRKNEIQLVESILMGYPVPEIYLWKTGTDENTGSTKYSIIDGQQRCGAIFAYIANNYKLNEGFLSSKDEATHSRIKNKYFKELDADDKRAIWSYPFSVRIVNSDVERDSIVSMFLRLNSNNMTLNPQELRNAEFEGEFITVSSHLADLDFWESNKIFGVAERRRMRDVAFVSTLLVFMKEGIQEDINNINLNKIYDLYNDYYPNKESDISKFKSIIDIIDGIIDGQNGRAQILKRNVHFYTLFTTVYELTLDKGLTAEQKKNYCKFIDNYDNDEILENEFLKIKSDIYKYKALSKEGTRQKSNRIERQECLKKVFNYH